MSEILQKDDAIIAEIIAGARTLFEKFGLKKTTMEDIAKEVGKGKSSLYYYFPSKYEIFEAVVDQETTELFSQAQIAIDKATTAKEKLKAYSTIRLCKINKMGNLSQVVKNDLMDNLSVIMNIKKKHEKTQFIMVKEIIIMGIESGEFKKVHSKDIDLLAFLFVAAFRGIALPMCSSDFSFPDLTKSVDTIVDIMVEGIGNQKSFVNNN
jgi:AcrR family transcriptional regulator